MGEIRHVNNINWGLNWNNNNNNSSSNNRRGSRENAVDALVNFLTSNNYNRNNNNLYRIEEVRKVTAILVLFGLPHDLAASILAHEAMHAWLRLRKDFPAKLPAMVEEGICQLVAYKYLQYLSEQEFITSGSKPSKREYEERQEERYRDYFRNRIATDSSPIYGDGYRAAQIAETVLPLPVLLEHIAQYQNFPIL